MPLKWFICPDGERITTEDCIAKCRMAERCLTIPTLINASKEREWDGTPHVTQLLNGTMEEFLKATQDYAIQPHSTVYAQLGTAYHATLEALADELELPAELHFIRDGVIQGTADFLQEHDDEPGVYDLIDYKTWGSYRVAKSLGLVKRKNPLHSGNNRSHPDYWMFYVDEQAIDNRDAELQLNKYRVELQRQGYAVERMYIQAIIRDSGLQAARNMGVFENAKMIRVNYLPDELVDRYFLLKGMALKQAIEVKPPPPCSPDENWNERKCQHYCNVAEFCPIGQRYHTPYESAPDTSSERIDV